MGIHVARRSVERLLVVSTSLCRAPRSQLGTKSRTTVRGAVATVTPGRNQKTKGAARPPSSLNYPGGDLLSHAVTSAVPSALEGLTSVFEMGTGVAPPASPPGNCWQSNTLILKCSQTTPHEYECKRGQAARPISTARLNALRRLHPRPINLVIFQGPSEGLRPGRSHLEAGFALRCLQRLSLPDIATQRCSWRNSWHTSGPSTPVLSY
jgi:hypothetical protein